MHNIRRSPPTTGVDYMDASRPRVCGDMTVKVALSCLTRRQGPFIKLIEAMLSPAPEDRPTIHQVAEALS